MNRVLCFVVSVMAFTSTSVLAQVNSWTSPTSGVWDDPLSWSLGIVPGSSQSVMITNAGWKAVAINPSTPINSPGSMTVSNLTIIGATNTENTLLLNYFGTALPLTISNGLTLQSNAQILDFNSGLVVQSGTIEVTNSQINQDGGFINTTNAQMNLSDSVYNLTNGVFEGGQVVLGSPVAASFNQYGGMVVISNLQFGIGALGAGGNYALYGGNLNLPNGLTIMGDNDSFSSYFQSGGTNQTTEVTLEPGVFGISPSFILNGGLLADNDVSLDADNFGGITLTQNGGTHVITNTLNLAGSAASSTEIHPAVYQLNGGTLFAGTIHMDGTSGTAEINQTDGVVQVGQMTLIDAQDQMTNGLFEGGEVLLGSTGSANFNQYGGTVIITNLQFGQGSKGAAEEYALHGGNLSLPNGLTLMGGGGNTAMTVYFQAGGTNQTTGVLLEPGVFGGPPSFTLNGGLLADDDVSVDADNYGSVTLIQNGGTHVITNGLNISGAASGPNQPIPGVYQLNGGMLTAGSMTLDATDGTAEFNETNGIAQVGDIEAHTGSVNDSYFAPSVSLSGGGLSCSNFSVTGGGSISQTGGALVVSNSLSFDGYLQTGPAISRQYSQYQITAGTLAASNIIIGGTWSIGDSAGTISNPGTCTLSHTLQIGNAIEQLGRFILADNSLIDLAGSTSQLSFANSSGETWAGGATLVVTNWNGNPAGGGAEQLKFGTDQSGLTTAQLNQVRFHIGTNLYSAKILSTGEVVPAQAVTPPLIFVRQGNNLVLSWLPGYTLQTSTNVSGPYANATDQTGFPAVSPDTNAMTDPQRFFRIAP